MSDLDIKREHTFLILGSLTVVVLLFLFVWQAVNPDYDVTNRTILIISGLIYSFLQVNILGEKLSLTISPGPDGETDGDSAADTDSENEQDDEGEEGTNTNARGANTDS